MFYLHPEQCNDNKSRSSFLLGAFCFWFFCFIIWRRRWLTSAHTCPVTGILLLFLHCVMMLFVSVFPRSSSQTRYMSLFPLLLVCWCLLSCYLTSFLTWCLTVGGWSFLLLEELISLLLISDVLFSLWTNSVPITISTCSERRVLLSVVTSQATLNLFTLSLYQTHSVFHNRNLLSYTLLGSSAQSCLCFHWIKINKSQFLRAETNQ